MAYKGVAVLFGKLLRVVKERLVELECQILEDSIPLTVGVPTIQKKDLEDDNGDDFELGFDDDEMEDEYDDDDDDYSEED